MPSNLERLRSALADRYAVESEIGRGGMATVFLAEDLRHERKVAIKVLHPDLAATLGTDRFLREIKIAAGLNHPHILPLFDSGEAAGSLYFAMPYVEGESLQERLEAEVQLPIDEAVAIAAEVAEGLDYAHRQGVIHRDIKPGNILLSEGHALIADFGVARAIGAASEGEGLAVGTPNYMSPEQATADANVDGRSDVYALGCVLWEMLAGEPPFGGPTPQAIMARKAVEEAPDVRHVRGRVPEALEECLEAALAPAPADRFSSAAEFASALRDAVLLGVTPQAVARRKRKRRRRWLLAGLAVVAAVGGVLGWRGYAKQRQVEWARTEAVPEILRLVTEGKYDSAVQVATQLESVLPNDSTLNIPWDFFSQLRTIRTNPPGARVYRRPLREEGDTTWRFLGVSPIEDIRLPWRAGRFRFEKDGYETREILAGGTVVRTVGLGRVNSTPLGMVPVDGFEIDTALIYQGSAPFKVGDYYLDRFEVTNRQYKEFVDAGGYERPEYWVEPFTRDGSDLSREEAIRFLVDRTGRPGPGSWEGGTYPEGREDFPVGGLSWYEAAAYARFAGKSLPSYWHLRGARVSGPKEMMLDQSNLGATGPKAVGTTNSEGPYGTVDQYGNVREWAYNAEGDTRLINGGSWSDDDTEWDEWTRLPLSPWDRSPENGMRLALYPDTAGVASANVVRFIKLAQEEHRDYSVESPANDADYATYARMYDYEPMALDPLVELADTVYDWPMERVSFAGPDGTDRMGVYLFTPSVGRPPYQAVLYFTGYAPSMRNFEDWHAMMLDYILRTGRAVAVPILYGTFEPFDAEKGVWDNDAQQPPEIVIRWVKEIRRTVDYLQTRPDIDGTRIAYYGMYIGAMDAPIVLALESRIAVAFTETGGLFWLLPAPPPEVDPFNFLPRVRTPILIMNSRYADYFPYRTNLLPMLEHLGTPDGHKRLLIGPYAQSVQFYEIAREVGPWFDEYLGSVEGF